MEASQPILAHTGWDTTRLMYRISDDNGLYMVRGQPFPWTRRMAAPQSLNRTRDRRNRAPVSDERNNRDLSFFVMTKDNGATWTRSVEHPESAVARRTAGGGAAPRRSLIAFLRTAPRLLQTESSISGKTWTPAKLTDFKNPDAAI